MRGTSAYFNGEWMPFEAIRIDPLDRGFVTGDAFFDAARTFDGVGFRLQEHIDRLYRSLAYARLDPRMSSAQMLEITEEVLRRNEPGRAEIGDWQVWQFVSRGPGRWAHDAGPPSVGIKVSPVDFGRFAHLYDTGAHAVITRFQSTQNNSLDPKLKCYSRMHYNLAELEAADVAAEGWPLLTDDRGNITEGSAYNVFVVKRGVVRTPTTRNTLEGISRSVVIDLAGRLSISAVEEDIQPFDLYTADEVFFSGTSPCVLPVTRVNHQRVGDGEPGEITRRILAAWNEMVGVDIAEQARKFADRG